MKSRKTDALCERFYRTVPRTNSPARRFSRTCLSVQWLKPDLDAGLVQYNQQKPHQAVGASEKRRW